MKKYVLGIFVILSLTVATEVAMLFFLQNSNTIQFLSALQTTTNAFFQKNSSIALFTSIVNAKKNPLCEVATTKLVYSGVIREIETFSKQRALKISLAHSQVKTDKLIAMTVNTDTLVVTKLKKKVNYHELMIGNKIKIIYDFDQKNSVQLNSIEILQ